MRYDYSSLFKKYQDIALTAMLPKNKLALQKRRLLSGFTLIESLVFIFIFALVSVVFFQVYTVGTRMIIESKNRLGATALANQKMEIVRSISYDAIGTKHWNGAAWVYGIPGGDLLEDETISVNTVKYEVHTFVQYADDAFDGTLGGTPNDLIPSDYKRVRVTVAWGSEGVDQTVSTFGNFSPQGVETSAGGGVLSLNVLDAAGNGVPSVDVHLSYPAQSIDLNATTDATGNITLPGSPIGTESYVLAFSKSGYYGATTYPPYPTSAFSPVDVHASVVAGVLNQKTVVMDRKVDVALMTQDPFGVALPNIGITVSGGRVLGTDLALANVYGFSVSGTTDSTGKKTFADQSYGQYTFAQTSSQYELWKMLPETSATANAFNLAPGSSAQTKAILLNKSLGSVKTLVTSQVGSSPVSGASVRLSNTTLGYDTTLVTDQYGSVYFPSSLPALASGTYTIEVTASGFTNYSGTVAVNGTLVTKSIALSP